MSQAIEWHKWKKSIRKQRYWWSCGLQPGTEYKACFERKAKMHFNSMSKFLQTDIQRAVWILLGRKRKRKGKKKKGKEKERKRKKKDEHEKRSQSQQFENNLSTDFKVGLTQTCQDKIHTAACILSENMQISVSHRQLHKLYLLVLLIFGPNIVYKCSSKSGEVGSIRSVSSVNLLCKSSENSNPISYDRYQIF